MTVVVAKPVWLGECPTVSSPAAKVERGEGRVDDVGVETVDEGLEVGRDDDRDDGDRIKLLFRSAVSHSRT